MSQIRKKRKTTSIEYTHPLVQYTYDLNDFQQKKILLNYSGTHIKLTKEIKSILKRIRGSTHELSDDEKKIVQPVLTQVITDNAVKFMASALLFYEQKHNFVYKRKDVKVIMRAKKTTKVTYDQLRSIYDFYLCGIEEKHHYYWASCQATYNPPKKRVVKTTKKKRMGAYNLFIKDQWLNRREELDQLKVKHGSIVEIMKLLSIEWNQNPKLKEEYQLKAKQLLTEGVTDTMKESSL